MEMVVAAGLVLVTSGGCLAEEKAVVGVLKVKR